MKRREAEAMVEEMLQSTIKRLHAGEPHHGLHRRAGRGRVRPNQYVVAYVAAAGPGNYFGGIVEVEVTPFPSFQGAVVLACRRLAETIAPKNVGQVFSATGALRVHHVSTGKEEIFAGDSV